jgi:hypothetical protein
MRHSRASIGGSLILAQSICSAAATRKHARVNATVFAHGRDVFRNISHRGIACFLTQVPSAIRPIRYCNEINRSATSMLSIGDMSVTACARAGNQVPALQDVVTVSWFVVDGRPAGSGLQNPYSDHTDTSFIDGSNEFENTLSPMPHQQWQFNVPVAGIFQLALILKRTPRVILFYSPIS